MGQIATRHYRKEDANACLAIFDSNVPRFFGSEERVEFAQFLGEVDRSMFPYLVLTLDGRIVACGGLSIASEPTMVSLSWGMVDQAYHRRGLGTRLTRERLNLARSSAGIAEVSMATSQHTSRFYEKHGFRIERITPNGFAAGLDRYDMTLRLG
ncbi:GNAT family N-acetyltransferase (plasmid) [Agrobacterium tumefaciens]|jgi:ribosomal protein S18 acetylase RimI-like enzyme|uniref:GNAT family N-acetyltransferase n=1 Tax=Agrobacterium tumefaciens TaxID=358 RepID=UPI001574B41E|nr:GNAT family N-acetyltransferase [Agrobacterium tumefaciens]NSZ87253.1 GNAT family N-acetyltransferase [Agrobacterium tumefaciens]WCA72842.1 GNAT family N-acetyltransferase [Agrobacterium tumefaciens]